MDDELGQGFTENIIFLQHFKSLKSFQYRSWFSLVGNLIDLPTSLKCLKLTIRSYWFRNPAYRDRLDTILERTLLKLENLRTLEISIGGYEVSDYISCYCPDIMIYRSCVVLHGIALVH